MTGHSPDQDAMIALVRRYFGAVDAHDIDGVLATLTGDCRFSVETHGVVMSGHDQIRAMFTRLWQEHRAVLHDRFHFVADAGCGRIAAQFHVTNTLGDGQLVHKSNCNFFDVAGDRFSSVAVYMAGENTLR